MGVLDKIKNALFEVEYVEVEEPPKKEDKKKFREKRATEKIKEKAKNKEKVVKEKPIAKKIVLPGKKEEKIEELEEEELKDEDFEIRPKNEVKKEKQKEEFKFMDDKDFQMDQDYSSKDPEILQVIDDSNVINNNKNLNEVRKRENIYQSKEDFVPNSISDEYSYSQYKPQQDTRRDNKLYGIDDSYSVPVHEYGTYEKKEEKSYFKPSPIISPIYGVLDKNYKKDDVKEKKEVRLTTYSRTNVSVDDIRDKAYGVEKEPPAIEENSKFEVEEEDNVLVDLSDRTKPEVKELTMGDAEEYFQDLGLEYNVDYVDVSKEKTKAVNKETSQVNTKETEKVGKHGVVEEKKKEEPRISKVVQVDDENKVDSNEKEEDNDNLFDLIDSMYEEKGE